MTDLVTPGGINTEVDNLSLAETIAEAAASDGWIAATTILSQHYTSLDETAMNAFTATTSSTSLDVTFDAGEGFVGGGWVARDVQTTVTLTGSSTTTVAVGWDPDVVDTDQVLIQPEGDFGAREPSIPLYTFTTDTLGVTGTTDERQIGQAITVERVEATTTFRLPNSFE